VEEPYRLTPQLAIRIAVLGIVAVVLFCVLFFRLWALQVLSGDRYLESARNNQVREFRVPAARGTIVDADGEVLVANTPGTTVSLWPATLAELPEERRKAMVRRLSELLNVPLGEIQAKLRRAKADPLSPVVIKTSVREPKVNYLYEHQSEFPGVQIDSTQLRRYELGSLSAHILGYVGEISPERLAELEGKGYAAGDRVGQTGVELTYDEYLKGEPGVGNVRVDALGRVTSARSFSQLPEAGHSIRLTIDADLQRAAENAIRYGIELARETYEKGWAANGGAIVALDPTTGAIRALASYPTFDPSIWVERDAKKLARLGDPEANHPGLNRAVAGLYPPGSVFKPVTALAALQEGMLSPTEFVSCIPVRIVQGQRFENWDPYVNEPMELTTALAASCDTYFYEVGLRFYRREDSPLQRWARLMGFNSITGIDVGPEASGLIPTPAWRRKHFTHPWDREWHPGDSVQLAIGQGDVLVTPLQMARFYALVANGGKLVEPHVVQDVEEPGTEGAPPLVLRQFRPKPPKEIGVDPGALQAVRIGLYDATHAPYGTSSRIFGTFPVDIAGKTGTAEKYVEMGGYKGLLDQSWFCGYGPYSGESFNGKSPLVVCALIENGGHGGTAAAPAARLLFEEWFGVQGDPIAVEEITSD
jgi:penicillin-binding protein 2